jgi:DNA-3-methyladenine glycosylase
MNTPGKNLIDMEQKLEKEFFKRDVLLVAPDLLGKFLVRKFGNGETRAYAIKETEAYRGEEDLGCHASRGKTNRTSVMYDEGGKIYVYLIYGMYWMLNFVTGNVLQPQAVLIRGIEEYNGPGKLTRALEINKSFNQEDITANPFMWVEDRGLQFDYHELPRVGIDYAGEEWAGKPWRFLAK